MNLKALEEIFGDRLSVEDAELRLCTHDVGNLPDIVGIAVMDLLVNRMATAIVQPVSTDEVVALLKFATAQKVPVTPRAAGTSGVMGAVPAKGGIVVELMRMNKILEIDKEGMTVTVQPGVVWNPLEEELNRHDLSLPIYPSSAPSSAVGGWIGSGGIVGENIVGL